MMGVNTKYTRTTETFGNSFLGWSIGLGVLFVLFYGDPDVVDAIRSLVLSYAGLPK